ncbi:sugar ABC transporter permease [Paenibacillus sp. CGMCC 1.16610]|uniref:ABC transporter permease subunit n=1 Tax=Paenibacillus anseongense TaxID=2682845 RepID=A0ABW9UGZ9_9BACL|nr:MULTISPECIES: sugar ABC transporter permease [Paenibacillus]MBA2939474.1 sugar ABC transporter permease [Paenibacillus sp. CGMCC 1.16610]MVQ39138.1 ABC transporter permease subunit [Paenibacillus anseongense]
MVKQKYLFIYSCLLLPLFFFLSIRIVPILYSFNISFREWDMLSEEKPFVGLQNFVHLFQDEVFIASIRNTLIYVIVGVPAQLLVGLVIALLLQRLKWLKGFFRTLYFIPYVTSVVAVSWVFRWTLMKNGIVNALLIKLGFEPQLFLGSPSQGIYIIITVMIWQNIGFQMLIFLTGLETVPKSYEEAAAIDGANSWQRLWHITLPLLNPVIVFSIVIATISFLQSFTQVLNMTNGGPLNSTVSLVLYIYNLAFKHFKMGEASAATIILFAMILSLSLLQMKILNRKIDY